MRIICVFWGLLLKRIGIGNAVEGRVVWLISDNGRVADVRLTGRELQLEAEHFGKDNEFLKDVNFYSIFFLGFK